MKTNIKEKKVKKVKKYIFLTASISNIGGAELYMRQKLLYVKSIGFDPLIIYVKNLDLYI